jgi:hypothetical protein
VSYSERTQPALGTGPGQLEYFHVMASSAWADGIITVDASGTVLDALYPSPQLGDPAAGCTDSAIGQTSEDPMRAVRRQHHRCVIADLDSPPALR